MSGIAFLRRLLMKQAMKKSAGSSGIMSLNKGLARDVETQVAKWVDSAKKQGADIDKMGEQEIKYIVEFNKPKLPKVIAADSPEGEIMTRDLFNMIDRRSGKNVIKTDFGGGITDNITETITKIKTMEPMDAMKEANKVLKGEGRYKSLSKADRNKIVNDESVTDHIFERNIKPDPEDFAHGGRSGTGLNYLLGEDDQNSRVPYSKGSRKRSWTDRIAGWTGGKNIMAGEIGLETWDLLNNLLQSGGLYAEGGRIGLGLGGISKARRAFLKIMGAGAAGVGIAKSGLFSLLKGGGKKAVIKDLTSIPIKGGVDGMPLWFKPLVNKVIKEGDDVTKNYATLDRQIVHKTKLPDSQTDVIVTQDITSGNVSVDIGMGKHGFGAGHHGQPVRLEYKASEVIEPTIKKGKIKSEGTKTKEEFWVEEAEFTGGHPENIKFEETVSEKFGQHGSNFDEVEKFATGKVKKKKPLKKAEKTEFEQGRAENEYDLQKQEGYFDEAEKDFYEKASGGRVPSSGGLAGMLGE